MKKLCVLFVGIITLSCTARADDKPISFEQLPAAAQHFIQTHFADHQISGVTLDDDWVYKKYDVRFSNGDKIEFNTDGDWTELDCEHGMVPEGVVPAAIANMVHDRHAHTQITKIERDRKGYKVELANDMELIFNRKLEFIRYDD